VVGVWVPPLLCFVVGWGVGEMGGGGFWWSPFGVGGWREPTGVPTVVNHPPPPTPGGGGGGVFVGWVGGGGLVGGGRGCFLGVFKNPLGG